MQEKEKSAGTGQKKKWFQGLQSEFKKIVWVDRPTLVKQTIAVVAITVVLAVIIQYYGFCNPGRCKSFNEIRITVIVCQKQNGMLFILIQGMKTK